MNYKYTRIRVRKFSNFPWKHLGNSRINWEISHWGIPGKNGNFPIGNFPNFPQFSRGKFPTYEPTRMRRVTDLIRRDREKYQFPMIFVWNVSEKRGIEEDVNVFPYLTLQAPRKARNKSSNCSRVPVSLRDPEMAVREPSKTRIPAARYVPHAGLGRAVGKRMRGRTQ